MKNNCHCAHGFPLIAARAAFPLIRKKVVPLIRKKVVPLIRKKVVPLIRKIIKKNAVSVKNILFKTVNK